MLRGTEKTTQTLKVVWEKINYIDRTELYDLETQYIIKYDNIKNGWNWKKNELDFDFGMPDPHPMDSTFFNT